MDQSRLVEMTKDLMSTPAIAMGKRRRFNTTERLAAAYLAVPGLVPEPLRSSGTAKQIVAFIEADHNFPFAMGGGCNPQNLNLLAKPVHAAKTRKDIANIAKSKRLAAKVAEFHRKLFAKQHGLQLPIRTLTRKGNIPLPCGRNSSWRKPLGSFISIRREPR